MQRNDTSKSGNGNACFGAPEKSGKDSRLGAFFKGSEVSNTDPTTLHKQLVGLDYLVFWVFGSFEDWDALTANLERQKVQAQADDTSSVLALHDVSFSVAPHAGQGRGAHSQKWLLSTSGVTIGVTSQRGLDPELKKPNLRVEVKGETLTHLGVRNCLDLVDKLLRCLGVTYRASKISRVDIRQDLIDVSVGQFIQAWEQGRMVRRSRSWAMFGKDDLDGAETFYIGQKKSPVKCRIYDKLEQVKGDKRKEVLVEDFVLGGETVDRLTRVEFEVRRDAFSRGCLKPFKVDSVEDLLGNLGRISAYLVSEWLRVTDRKPNGHTERTKPSKLWLVVQEGMEYFARTFVNRRAVARVREQDCNARKISSVIGNIASLMAEQKVEPTSATAVWDFVRKNFGSYFLDLEDIQEKFSIATRRIADRCADECLTFFENQTQEPVALFAGAETEKGWWND